MEVAPSDDVAFVEVLVPIGLGLDVQVFLSYMWQGGASTKPPSRFARRDLIDTYQVSDSKGRSPVSRGPFAPWRRSGFVFPNVNHS